MSGIPATSDAASNLQPNRGGGKSGVIWLSSVFDIK